MLTQAAVLHKPGVDGITIDNVHLDEPRGHEVLVQVRAAGLCHSDLHVITGLLPAASPRVLGHELAGIVCERGELVTSMAPGDHVVACLAMACGQCARCDAGYGNLCLRRSELWARQAGEPPRVTATDGSPVAAGSGIGGLAQHALIDERGLCVIPAAMPLVPAALLSCAVLTGTGAALRSARVSAGSSVVVIGCGGVGLSIIQGARIAGADKIIAVDREPRKLPSAAAFGATHAVLATAAGHSHVARVREITDGGVDYAFDAVGTSQCVEDALRMLGARGLATIVGVFPDGIDVHVPARDMLTRETRLQGSYLGSSQFRRDIPELCELYKSGTLLLDELVEPTLPLTDVRAGFDQLASGTALRPVVVMEA